MPTLKRDGLIDALLDFGVDMSPNGLALASVASPVLGLQDLTYNYEPCLRARLCAYVSRAALGGNLSIVSIQARHEGFWIRRIHNVGALFILAHVSSTRLLVGGGTVIGWDVIGSAPGELRFNNAATDFFSPSTGTPSNFGVSAVAVPAGAAIPIAPATTLTDLWVPGNGWLNIYANAQNLALDVGIDIQVPALNPGRFP